MTSRMEVPSARPTFFVSLDIVTEEEWHEACASPYNQEKAVCVGAAENLQQTAQAVRRRAQSEWQDNSEPTGAEKWWRSAHHWLLLNEKLKNRS